MSTIYQTVSPSEIEHAFQNYCAEQGVVFTQAVIADGKLHRDHVEGDKRGTKNGAYILHADDRPAGWLQHFNSGITSSWTLSGKREPMPPDMRRQIEEARQQRQIEQQLRHDDAANKARHTWSNAKAVSEQSQHPYLINKRIQPHGLRAFSGVLVVPIYDEAKRMVNLQLIQADGTKRFLSGGKKKGCFSVIGKAGEVIQICEGYATGASLHESTGHFAVVALDAGNLEAVAVIMRKLYPTCQIIVCGDNDENGVGQKAARAAALAVTGKYLIPAIAGQDWNDVLTMEVAL
ncbi:MAG: toprim domain-containing protein [Methylobacter sp.]